MYSKILIRYGELVLKKKNRKFFTNCLKQNAERILGQKVDVQFDRMYTDYSEETVNNLQYIFGISSYSPVVVCSHEMNEIKENVLKLVRDDSKTFKIEARRHYKQYPVNSSEINNILGGHVLKNTKLKVDVHNPDQTFYVEVREKNVYIFSDYIQGIGGLPVGSSGKILHLLSGGIDSPVAALQLMKRGLKVEFLSFITPPHTDEKTVNKMKHFVQVLSKYQGVSYLHLANYTFLMNYLALTSNQSYKITLMRRSFYRIAEIIAKNKRILALSNGDNLGQVASQTLESMAVIGKSTDMQILRPLLSYDKNEIINIARKIGTYETSIIKANETCELFAPKEPVTKPDLETVIKLEEELDMINSLEEKLIKEQIQSIKIS